MRTLEIESVVLDRRRILAVYGECDVLRGKFTQCSRCEEVSQPANQQASHPTYRFQGSKASISAFATSAW